MGRAEPCSAARRAQKGRAEPRSAARHAQTGRAEPCSAAPQDTAQQPRPKRLLPASVLPDRRGSIAGTPDKSRSAARPAAGGWAFGRLRGRASQARRRHPCKLLRRTYAARGSRQPAHADPQPLAGAQGTCEAGRVQHLGAVNQCRPLAGNRVTIREPMASPAVVVTAITFVDHRSPIPDRMGVIACQSRRVPAGDGERHRPARRHQRDSAPLAPRRAKHPLQSSGARRRGGDMGVDDADPSLAGQGRGAGR